MEGLKKVCSEAQAGFQDEPEGGVQMQQFIYGAPSAGHEFEMLIHSVHTETCGCTQTQPEPSIYVRIVVDKDDELSVT